MPEASSELVRQFGCSSSDKGIVCGFGRTGDVSISSAEIAHAVNAKAWQRTLVREMEADRVPYYVLGMFQPGMSVLKVEISMMR